MASYLNDVRAEMAKVTWPTPKEWSKTFRITLATVVCAAAAIAVIDMLSTMALVAIA